MRYNSSALATLALLLLLALSCATSSRAQTPPDTSYTQGWKVLVGGQTDKERSSVYLSKNFPAQARFPYAAGSGGAPPSTWANIYAWADKELATSGTLRVLQVDTATTPTGILCTSGYPNEIEQILLSGSSFYAFGVVDVPSGTDPVATTFHDTLIFTLSGGATNAITGPGSKTVNFAIHDPASLSAAIDANLLSLSTQVLGLDNQTSGTFFAGPTVGGAAAAPAFRVIAASDLPAGTTPVGANPTASVGLSVINGSAATFLRSDGAPPLDQGIVPTWTGAHTWSANTTLNANTILGNEGSDTLVIAASAPTFTNATTGTPTTFALFDASNVLRDESAATAAGLLGTALDGVYMRLNAANSPATGEWEFSAGIETATIQHTNGTGALTIDTSGNVTADHRMAVTENFAANGTTSPITLGGGAAAEITISDDNPEWTNLAASSSPSHMMGYNSTTKIEGTMTAAAILTFLSSTFDNSFLLLDASNDPVTGNLALSAGLGVTGASTFTHSGDGSETVRITNTEAAGEAFGLIVDNSTAPSGIAAQFFSSTTTEIGIQGSYAINTNGAVNIQSTLDVSGTTTAAQVNATGLYATGALQIDGGSTLGNAAADDFVVSDDDPIFTNVTTGTDTGFALFTSGNVLLKKTTVAFDSTFSTNTTFGDATTDTVTKTAKSIYTEASQAISSAATAITVAGTYVALTIDTSRTLTATPTLADGTNGEILYIVNEDSADTITLQDGASFGLALPGSANLALGPQDTLTLMYNSTLDLWLTIATSNN